MKQRHTFRMTTFSALTCLLLLCVGAAPNKPHPLQLIIPGPDEAIRLAPFKTYPDETVVEKVKNLERVAREANPDAKPWSIYLTPRAATIVIKGWKEDLNRPDTPLPEAPLGECLDRLARRVPELRQEILDGQILIDLPADKPSSIAPSQNVMTRGLYSMKRAKETTTLVTTIDVDAVKTNLPAGYELQHSTEYKTGEKERIFYNKDSNRKIRVKTMLFPSVTEAENGVISQLKSVSVIFTSGSPSGGTIGDNSWFNTTEGTGSTAVTFIRRNVVISVFAQQDAAVADKLARDLDADILAGKNGIELKDHK